MSVPLEMHLLFIGAVYLDINPQSLLDSIGLPAVLGVLLLGLLINLQILDVHPSEVERLQTFSLALLLFMPPENRHPSHPGSKYGLVSPLPGSPSRPWAGGCHRLADLPKRQRDHPGLGNAIPRGQRFCGRLPGVNGCRRDPRGPAPSPTPCPQKVQDLLESSVNDPSALILFSVAASLFTVGVQGQALPEVIISAFSSCCKRRALAS